MLHDTSGQSPQSLMTDLGLKFLTILKRFAFAQLYSRRKEFQGVHELAALGSPPRPCSSKLGMALGLIERLDFQGPVSGFCLPIGGCRFLGSVV